MIGGSELSFNSVGGAWNDLCTLWASGAGCWIGRGHVMRILVDEGAGGAIFVLGQLTASNTEISNNQAEAEGGGIYVGPNGVVRQTSLLEFIA